MQPKGSGAKYITYHEAPTDEQLRRHLAGEITLGVCLIGQDGKARAWAFDTDEGGTEGVRARLEALAAAGYPGIGTAAPGSEGHDGGHGWGYWPKDVEPAHGRAEIKRILEAAGLPTPELWPKGNAIRGPLGVHTHTGKRGTLIRPGMPDVDADTPDGLAVALEALATLEPSPLPPAPEPVVPAVPTRGPVERARRRASGPTKAADVIARFNAEHSVEQIITRNGGRVAGGLVWCNCGEAHGPHNQGAITSEGNVAFYSTRCRWAPAGKPVADAFALFAQVEHGGNTVAALKAYNPIESAPRARPDDAEADARAARRAADAERKRRQRQEAAAATLQAVRDRAAEDQELTACDRKVLHALLEVAGDRAWCRPSKAQLVELTDYSLGSVKRSLMRLESFGYFVSEGEGGGPNNTAVRTFLRGSCMIHESKEHELQEHAQEQVSAAPEPPAPPTPEPVAEPVAFEGGCSFDPEAAGQVEPAASSWQALCEHWARILPPQPAEPLPDPVGQLPLSAERLADELASVRYDVRQAWRHYHGLKRAGASGERLRAAYWRAKDAEQHAAGLEGRQRETLRAAAGLPPRAERPAGRRARHSPAPSPVEPVQLHLQEHAMSTPKMPPAPDFAEVRESMLSRIRRGEGIARPPANEPKAPPAGERSISGSERGAARAA